MSVIAYYKGEIGVDTMGICAHTGLWIPQQKLFGFNDMMWAAFCGPTTEVDTAMASMTLMASVISYMEKFEVERYVVDDESDHGRTIFLGLDVLADHSCFFVTRNGCYYVSEDRRVERANEYSPVFGGSAGSCVATALLLGQPMLKAINTAINIGQLCRGEAIVEKTRKLRKLTVAPRITANIKALRLTDSGDGK